MKQLHLGEIGVDEVDVFKLVQWLVKWKPDADYFIDEYAFFGPNAKIGE